MASFASWLNSQLGAPERGADDLVRELAKRWADAEGHRPKVSTPLGIARWVNKDHAGWPDREQAIRQAVAAYNDAQLGATLEASRLRKIETDLAEVLEIVKEIREELAGPAAGRALADPEVMQALGEDLEPSRKIRSIRPDGPADPAVQAVQDAAQRAIAHHWERAEPPDPLGTLKRRAELSREAEAIRREAEALQADLEAAQAPQGAPQDSPGAPGGYPGDPQGLSGAPGAAQDVPNADFTAVPGPDGDQDAADFVNEIIHEPGFPDLLDPAGYGDPPAARDLRPGHQDSGIPDFPDETSWQLMASVAVDEP